MAWVAVKFNTMSVVLEMGQISHGKVEGKILIYNATRVKFITNFTAILKHS